MADVRALLGAMIGVDSVNRHISGRAAAESGMIDLLERVAGRLGLVTERLPVAGEADDLLVTAPVTVEGPWLLLECHVDTVGVEGMSVPPFEATGTPGRIHGRGACDAKASGAAMLVALAAHARTLAGQPAAVNGAVLFTVDEEITRAGIRRFLDTHLATLPWRPAAVISGEPTRLRMVVAHNGLVRAVIRTRGIAAHSSDPGLGRSAISAMLPIVRSLEEEMFPAITASHPLTGAAVGSVNVIRGGEQVNIIPAACEIHVDRRTVPGESGQAVMADLVAFLDRMRSADPMLEVELTDPVIHGCLDPDTNASWATIVGATLARLGLDPEGVGVAYGTDAADLGALGIPALVLGPGDIAQAHAADEWVAIDQLERAVTVYREVLRGPLPPAPTDP
ncbi:MAG: M20/M25/M40 family metallo-hydrolase [Chloroflexi bacterium]|nr:M20/M25/M40 family metallo-hydrolase [Chloroflexota bacterium]